MKASTGEYFNEIFTSKRSMRGYMVKLMNLSLNSSHRVVAKKQMVLHISGANCGCFSDKLTWPFHRMADGCFSEPFTW